MSVHYLHKESAEDYLEMVFVSACRDINQLRLIIEKKPAMSAHFSDEILEVVVQTSLLLEQHSKNLINLCNGGQH